jgi:hypothetical protein
MLLPPLTLEDIRMLLAIGALLLLTTSELIPYISGGKLLTSDIKKLRYLALVSSVLFLVAIANEILNMILNV